MRFGAKVPGPSVRIGGVEMKFNYQDYFNVSSSTGYETLLYDCMVGDASLFQRADSIEDGWKVVQPLLDLVGRGRDEEIADLSGRRGTALRGRGAADARRPPLAPDRRGCGGLRDMSAQGSTRTRSNSRSPPTRRRWRAASPSGWRRWRAPRTAASPSRFPAARRRKAFTGSWPRRLSLEKLPWPRMHFFWGDERFVAPDDPQSNFRMTREAMLSRAPIPPANIHAMPTTGLSAEAAAAAYERDLKAFYGAERLEPVAASVRRGAAGAGRRRPHRFAFSRLRPLWPSGSIGWLR